MRRREFAFMLGALSVSSNVRSFAASQRGPLFWLAKRGKARVFLFGFADAQLNDRRWFSSIRQAFADTAELWLETAPPAQDPESRNAVATLMQTLGHNSERSFFDALEPHLRERAAAYVTKLGIAKSAIEPLRPWLGYYTLTSAFWSKRKQPYQIENVDEVLRKLAIEENKVVHYEMPTGETFVRFMAAMSDKAQSQYIEWLLDYLDDQENGDNNAVLDWQIGKPSSRSLDRMRMKMPALYDVMQVRRNEWWAQKINSLLSSKGTYFVAVGQLHVLGPDGIPSQLQRLRIVKPSDLVENPRLKP